MSLEANEVAVAGTGNIWRAPVGTAFPTNISTAVNETLWTELGYTTEEGARFSFTRNITEFMGWQSMDVLRILTTATPREIAFDFAQFNQNTWATAMGGGTWTGSSPNFEYAPPAASAVDEFALIVGATDGSDHYRWCFRKVMNQSGVDFSLTRSNPIILPVTVKVLAADGGLGPFIFQTDDPNLGDATQAGS